MLRSILPSRPGSRGIIPGLVLAIGLLGLVHGHAATIFRTVDADGNPVFSDTPPPEGQAAETIIIGGPATLFTPPPPPADAADTAWDISASGADTEPAGYSAVSVQWPAHDEPVRENAGNVTVVALVEPQLRPGHSLLLLMDGEPVASSFDNSFPLTEVDRGTHSLVVQVVDDTGNVLASSEPSVFHMLRISL